MSKKCEKCLSKNVCRWYAGGKGKNLCCADHFPCPEQKSAENYIELDVAIQILEKYLTKDAEDLKDDSVVKQVYLMARDHAITYLKFISQMRGKGEI